MQKLILFILLLVCYSVAFSQDYTRTIGEGDYLDVVITTSSSSNSTSGKATIDGEGIIPNLAASSRFLAQASLGADYTSILQTSEIGYSAWIDHQLNLPVHFTLLGYCKDIIARHRAYLIETNQDTSIADSNGSSFVYNYFLFSWWKYAMDAEDVFRAKVALALSEIVVVSATPDFGAQPLGLASYYDILIRNAFGNYRDLLGEVTLHPIMGNYLSFLNNRKTDSSKNRYPDENYAREVMQLFSIGLYELNIDGTQKTDVEGNAIPTYNSNDIGEFAKIFTGLSWGDQEKFGNCCSKVQYYSYTISMKMFDAEHEPGEKKLLNGFVVPSRIPVDGMADINDALNNLFNHPNVGPFLALRLIQRLIASNPSPEYIARVANVFNNNGSGTRGDMKAMVKAILTDPEARSCSCGEYAGKLKEPIHRQLQLFRGFNASSPLGEYRFTTNESYLEATDQRVLYSPTVFNFFLPDYQPNGSINEADLYAPEFQIMQSATIIGYANALHKWLFDKNLAGTTALYPGEYSNVDKAKLMFNFDEEINLLEAGKKAELIERINLVLMQGQMSAKTRDVISGAIDDMAKEGVEFQLDIAIYLAMLAPEFMIMK